MSVKQPHNAAKIAQLEARIAEGDWRTMWDYADDAMYHHLDDIKEVQRRQKILVAAMEDAQHGGAFIASAVLSAVTDKRDLWEVTSKHVIDDEPGLGYLAWRRIAFDHKDEARSEAWFDIVEDAARRGHFPSRRLVLMWPARKAGPLGRIIARFRAARIVVAQGAARRKDPSDPRTREYGFRRER
ncbi:MAG: hypothetical protein AAGA06_05955 [Pseudomonadota bacterium]